MKNLRLVCRPHQGPERRVLISVPDYSAITAVAAEKLGVAGSDILIQIKADGDDDLWEVDASFWGGIENGQTLFAAPVAGAASSSSSAAAVNTPQSSDSTHTKRKRKTPKPTEDATSSREQSSAMSARDSDADESSARPAKRPAPSTPRQHTSSQQATAAFQPQASGSAPASSSSSSQRLPSAAASGSAPRVQPASSSSWNALTSIHGSSRKHWTQRDDKFLWQKFRQRIDACSEAGDLPTTSAERTVFFQQIIDDHGTRGKMSRILTGRTASSIGTRLRAKVKEGVVKGIDMPQVVLLFFGMLRLSPRRTTSAEAGDGRGQGRGTRGNSAGSSSGRGNGASASASRHYVVVDDNDSDDGDEEYSTDGSESSHSTTPRSSVVLSRSAIAATPSASSSRAIGSSNSQPGPSSRSNRDSAVPVDALRPVGLETAASQPSMRKSTASSSATRPALPPHPRPLAPPAQHPFAPRPPANNGSTTTTVRGPPLASPAATTFRGTPTHTTFTSNGSPRRPSATPQTNGVATSTYSRVVVKDDPDRDETDELQERDDSMTTPPSTSRPPQPPGPPPPRPLPSSTSAQHSTDRAPARPGAGASHAATSGTSRAGPARWGNRTGIQFDLDFECSRHLAPEEEEPFTPCAGAHPEDVALLRMALDRRWSHLRKMVSQAVSLSPINTTVDPELDGLKLGQTANMMTSHLAKAVKLAGRKRPAGTSPYDFVSAADLTGMCAAMCLSLALAVFDCAPPSWSVRRTSFAIAGYLSAIRLCPKGHQELKNLVFVVAERTLWAMGCARPDKSSQKGPRGGAEHQMVHLCQDNAEDAAAAVILTLAPHRRTGAETDVWLLDQLRGVSTLATTPAEELYVEFWNSTGRTIEGTYRGARDAAAALLLSRFTALLKKLDASVAFLGRCSVPLQKWGASAYVLRSMAPAVPGAVRAQLMAANQDTSGRGLDGGTQALSGYVGQRMETYSKEYNNLLNAGVLKEH